MKIIVSICRVLVGGLFIFSGVIKANDPYGFSYKLEEYFVVFEESFHIGFTVFSSVSLPLSVFLCTLEIVLGIALLIGWKMRINGWILLVLILFFTWLTGFSAITGKVTDCGCFGDAIPITPVQSFYKDLILLALIVVIFIKRNSITSLFKGKISTSIVSAGTVLTIGFSMWCIMHLPVMDFRPYKVGNNIPELMTIPEGAQLDVYETMLVYKNSETDSVIEVSLADIPLPPWVWQETINKIIIKGYEPPIHDFNLSDVDGNDVTDELINEANYNFIVVAHYIDSTNEASFRKLNDIATKAEKMDLQFIVLTASSYDDTEPFRHKMQTAYEFYTADATMLKTIIRSNPGLILLRGGTVLAKWHYNDLPSFEKINEKYMNL